MLSTALFATARTLQGSNLGIYIFLVSLVLLNLCVRRNWCLSIFRMYFWKEKLIYMPPLFQPRKNNKLLQNYHDLDKLCVVISFTRSIVSLLFYLIRNLELQENKQFSTDTLFENKLLTTQTEVVI